VRGKKSAFTFLTHSLSLSLPFSFSAYLVFPKNYKCKRDKRFKNKSFGNRTCDEQMNSYC